MNYLGTHGLMMTELGFSASHNHLLITSLIAANCTPNKHFKSEALLFQFHVLFCFLFLQIEQNQQCHFGFRAEAEVIQSEGVTATVSNAATPIGQFRRWFYPILSCFISCCRAYVNL